MDAAAAGTLVVLRDPEDYLLSSRPPPLSIGQEFADVDACRRALKDMAIDLRFELRIVKSDRTRFIAKCAHEGCPWRVHIAKCPGVPTFSVRTLNDLHTCAGVSDLHHQQATVGWVARSVEARLRNNPQYKPKEILQDIRDRHGVAVSYMQAWRGKERSMAAVHGTLEDGYRHLNAYCEQICRTNPGSMACAFGMGPDNSFHRLFLSFAASIYGFINACRPLLELDKAELKGKYLGTLLCAAGVDGDGATFPLAFAVVDAETDDNWMWFLQELRKLLGANMEKIPALTILSERQPAVVQAVAAHFPAAFHGFCLRHVSDSFREEFKSPKLVNLFWSAVGALTTSEFDVKVAEMMEVQDISPWLSCHPPDLWAVSYFGGSRYGHLSLGITEALYSWAHDCHELPIVQMLEHIRRQLDGWFLERRMRALSVETVLVPSAEKLVLEAARDARCYQVLRANKVEFEVVSAERTSIVDAETRQCTCRRWQVLGVPCAHATAALMSCGEDAREYADKCFRADRYREAYSRGVYPVPEKSEWWCMEREDGGGGVAAPLRPPKVRRPPGRPKMKVGKAESLKRPKKVVQCGRCGLLGHSQKKCSVPLLLNTKGE